LVRTKHFSVLHNIQSSSWAHPAFCIRVWGSFPGLKQPEQEVNH